MSSPFAHNHAAKRRRLDDVSSTLSRPFKSPLKTTSSVASTHVAVNDKDDPPKVPDQDQDSRSTLPIASTESTTKPPSVHPLPSTSTSAPPAGPKSRPNPRHALHPLTFSSNTTDPELSSLHKRHTQLLTRLSTLRAELDCVRQALKIESTGSDAELEELVVKWRRASRGAAEEVYKGARDRVNRMGGVAGLREREKRRWDWQREGEEEFRHQQQAQLEEEEGGGGERRRDGEREGYEVDEREEGMERGKEEEGDNEDEDEQTFTMDMMLKSLNIDLEVIGFDKENQRWIE